MKEITVDKARLSQTLIKNRDEHQHMFDTAQVEFRAKYIEVVEMRLAAAKNGDPIKAYLSMPEPVNYTEAFDRAIAMVDWEEGDMITLSEQDFQRYVLNKWEWSPAFEANTVAYVAGSVEVE